MRRKRRHFSAFSLSFLDIMSCGFGAVVLLFLIIKHNVEANTPATTTTPDLSAEVNLLEEEIQDGQLGLAKLTNTIAEIDHELVTAEGLARRIMEKIRETEGEIQAEKAMSAADELAALQAQVRDLETKKKQLEAESKKTGEDTRSFTGEGNRQYLTGLKLGGQRILLLLDTSASMLDKSIVNVIRKKLMADERKINSRKWQQALKTVDWLSARFPINSLYQIYTFNTEVTSIVPGSKGRWLRVSDVTELNQGINKLKKMVPKNGTSLEKAFAAARQLQPRPDNIYLITDGLPTQGMRPPRFGSKVSGNERLKLFNEAVKQLPAGIPINVILAPMEGDPMAAWSFWGLAILTEGSFMSPAADWP